jgi:hypothetical protein
VPGRADLTGAGEFMASAYAKSSLPAARLGCLLLVLALVCGCRVRLEPTPVKSKLPGIYAVSAGAASEVRLRYADPSAYLPLAMAGAPVGIVHRFSLAQVFSAPDIPEVASRAEADEPLDFRFAGIDFNPGSARITLQITPLDKKVNQGEVITISFLPGNRCFFGDGQACVNSYRAENGQPVIYLTIHSGVGGQGQAYRHALEGTGLNQASYALDSVRKNLKSLQGARVTIQQGDHTRSGLVLAGTGRVPGEGMLDYFSLPIEHGLAAAAAFQPGLDAYILPAQPLLVFETCGWRMPEEGRAPGISATSASVYVGVIQAAP